MQRHSQLSLALLTVILLNACTDDNLQDLGTLEGGIHSSAYAVSNNGSVVVGKSEITPGGTWRAFRWTREGGMQNLGVLGDSQSSGAYGVSADGTVIVGHSWTGERERFRAFRWSTEDGMRDLGFSEANGVSADGLVIVGADVNDHGQRRAIRWTAESGIQDLGSIGLRTDCTARSVSADGTAIVGTCYTVGKVTLETGQTIRGNGHAFRWTEKDGMQDLGTLPNAWWSSSWGIAISADGGIVVGGSDMGTKSHIFHWTAESGIQDLSPLLGERGNSHAYAISADGGIMVGNMQVGTMDSHAFRWTAEGGVQDLGTLIYEFGTSYPYGISPDGTAIVGVSDATLSGANHAFLWLSDDS